MNREEVRVSDGMKSGSVLIMKMWQKDSVGVLQENFSFCVYNMDILRIISSTNLNNSRNIKKSVRLYQRK